MNAHFGIKGQKGTGGWRSVSHLPGSAELGGFCGPDRCAGGA
ncbi:hypothetical protein L288_08910 [Sphingobium quisquiliarum P25]|uniref:Uncharacterized protein n=1 Tax=Sphingobium quisquiliarum P25 TaxID=1329909 RepID=T0H4Y1_9SPHN|nr:hypothetical protein L288_08910 [Sphingobium quisquiliarum P25]